MFYLVKTNWLMRKWFPAYTWELPAAGNKLYLSFDDGPHPVATPFVLDTLQQFNAKASFFCIGKNVEQHPDIYSRILSDGHATGNHTHQHLNGWKVSSEEYFKDISKAKTYIDSNLFRPPYGRISRFQGAQLQKHAGFHVIMWSVLSGDFDKNCTPQRCLENVITNARAGSIIVFHDSEKAFERMRYALPKLLEYYHNKGYIFDKITL